MHTCMNVNMADMDEKVVYSDDVYVCDVVVIV